MSKIDDVVEVVAAKFPARLSSLSRGTNYVRILDTPHIWGAEFGRGMMGAADRRTEEFKAAVGEIVRKTRFRCDIASLNSPDQDWARIILEAMDVAMQAAVKGDQPQFRFLFGQTPMVVKDGLHQNQQSFQGRLSSFVAERSKHWSATPEIWIGVFSRLGSGVASGVANTVSELLPSWMTKFVTDPEEDDTSAKMTWNHAKIVAVDGIEALVGGHNLNMDLFKSYPPVHDLSVVVHGDAAHGAQIYLNSMWSCDSTLLSREVLRQTSKTLRWEKIDDDKLDVGKKAPRDPLDQEAARDWMVLMHGQAKNAHEGTTRTLGRKQSKPTAPKVASLATMSIQEEDLQTLKDIAEESPFDPPSPSLFEFTAMEEFRPATRILSVGKHWDGPQMNPNYRCASEAMKKELIGGATRILRLSQMDIVSAWKKKWESHGVCNWILDSLAKNPKLEVQVVVSPLDAGAGAEGDQYSFGWGAIGTFFLMSHFARLDVDGKNHPDAKAREAALARLHIAPFCYTEVGDVKEGISYHWPGLSETGYTASMNQLVNPKVDHDKRELVFPEPNGGIIGSAFRAGKMASGMAYEKVPSAPGNHAKLTIIDDEAYVVGSDNLYPGFLSEFNYLIEGPLAVKELLDSYWHPLWRYSRSHCVNPTCQGKKRCMSSMDASTRLSEAPKLTRTTSFGSLPRSSLPLSGGAKPRPRSPSFDLFGRSASTVSKSKRQLLGEHNYTNGEIYELMKHYVGGQPNVVVMGGIAPDQFADLAADAHQTDDTGQQILAPKVIYQPYNVHFNHWGVLRIAITQNGVGAQKRKADVLYADPLNPEDHLGFEPLERGFDIQTATYSQTRYQDDGMWGQHSCGAWVVWLAQQLVANNGALPPAPPNLKEFAIKLRELHQMVWDVHAAEEGWQS